MANAVPIYSKGLGAHVSNPSGQKPKDKNGKAFDLPHGRLLKTGELKMTRWPVERNPSGGKQKPLEWRRPATTRMTAGGRAPTKQQASPRTPAGATTGNHDGGLSDDSETEEEEREAPNEEELEELKMSKQAPAHPTGPKGRPFKGKAKGGKTRGNAQDPEWLAKNLKPSLFEPTIAGTRGTGAPPSPVGSAMDAGASTSQWNARGQHGPRCRRRGPPRRRSRATPRSSSYCSSTPWSNDASRAVRYNMNRSVTAFKTLPLAFTCVSWSVVK
jgi:hypothetical protein